MEICKCYPRKLDSLKSGQFWGFFPSCGRSRPDHLQLNVLILLKLNLNRKRQTHLQPQSWVTWGCIDDSCQKARMSSDSNLGTLHQSVSDDARKHPLRTGLTSRWTSTANRSHQQRPLLDLPLEHVYLHKARVTVNAPRNLSSSSCTVLEYRVLSVCVHGPRAYLTCASLSEPLMGPAEGFFSHSPAHPEGPGDQRWKTLHCEVRFCKDVPPKCNTTFTATSARPSAA